VKSQPWKRLLPIASAVGVAMLIFTLLPTEAAAATTSYPLLAGMFCSGNVADSGDPTNFPNGNFVGLGAWVSASKKSVAPTSQMSGGPVAGQVGWAWNTTCVDHSDNGPAGGVTVDGPMQNPCGQSGYWTGSYAINKKATPGPTGTLTVSFSDTPSINGADAEQENGDPLDGCTAVFAVIPYASSTSSYMTLSGPLTQTSGSSSTCKETTAAITWSCTNIDN